MSRLVYFPKEYFIKNIQRPLTPLMVKTLTLACNDQHKRILFGPKDVKGSFVTLISRGLLISKSVRRRGKNVTAWYVTQHAVNMLNDIGIKVSC